MQKDLIEYIEKNIIPKYMDFDKAHSLSHVQSVIEESLKLSKILGLNDEILYVAAAYHDLGLCENREYHHTISAKILLEDKKLEKWFTSDEISTMAKAVEDHRASSTNEPRSIYGKVICDADRVIDDILTIRRTLQFSLNKYNDENEEFHYQRVLSHLKNKFSETGYLKIWLKESSNFVKLQNFQKMIADENRLRIIFKKIYVEETVTC